MKKINAKSASFVFAVFMAMSSSAATIDYAGTIYTSDTSHSYPWVLGSVMWEAIDSGNSTATNSTGITYFDTHDVSKLTWTFGDLEMTDHLSPGADTAGYEIYTEDDGSTQPFTMLYDGEVIATGVSLSLRTDVENNMDATAVGVGYATLTAAGANSAFYDEIMTLSGNTGNLKIDIDNFDPVENGVFNSTGTLSVIPEPSMGALVGFGLMGFVLYRRFRR